MRKASIFLIATVLTVLLIGCSQKADKPGNDESPAPSSSFSAGESVTTTEPEESTEPPITSTESADTATSIPEIEESKETAAPTPDNSTPQTTSSQPPKPAESSKPAETSTPTATPPPATSTPTTPPPPSEPPVTSTPAAFDIQTWIDFAISHGESIGLTYSSTATGSWDTPITASATSKYLERDIKGYLDEYVRLGKTRFCVWAEQRPDGKYSLYIGYA